MARNVTQQMRQIIKVFASGKTFDGFLCRPLQLVEAADGHCQCTMVVGEEHTNRGDTLHGGMMAGIVDNVTTVALMTQGDGAPGVSVNLSLNYFKGAPRGSKLLIDARTTKVGKRLAFMTCDIREFDGAGDLIAQGKHIKYVAGGINAKLADSFKEK